MLESNPEQRNPGIQIRPLREVEEFRRCVEMQKSVWGFGELDVMPLRFFVVASRIGGQVYGAFISANEMVGFLCALSGMRGDLPYIHSHMLAVLPHYRNHGIARQLKLAQRADALERGYQLVEWTFDPLELKNAYFNIEKLGAAVRHYSPNHYGMTSSRLQAGLPTDRMIAEWWIQSDRVRLRLNGMAPNGGDIPGSDMKRIEVPCDVGEWKSKDLERAIKIQAEVRDAFLNYFKNGFEVSGFERGKKVSSYLLTKRLS